MPEQRGPNRARTTPARRARARRTPAEMLFVELTGEPVPPGGLGARLRSSLTTLTTAQVTGDLVGSPADDPVPGGPPRVWVFVRRQAGKDCDRVAEIAGTYFARLLPGQGCVGAAAVKKILDEAAAKLCCSTLKCP